MSVGIERLQVYVPQYALRLTELAAARDIPPEKLTAGLGVQEMAIAPPCEDVVTLAATAGARLLRAADVDPEEIGMLLVATETGVDHSKPVSIFVHDLLGIGRRCRVYELKHACYAGTAALMTAADWVRADGGRVRRALVIAADIARYEIGSPGEPTQGAGAVAMLVGRAPQALVLSEQSGTYAGNVHDFWRPLDRREAIVDGKYSVECYLDALAGAFLAYRGLERPPLAVGAALTDRLVRLLYHTPFPKMAMKAHRRLLEIDGRAVAEDAAAASYRTQAAPGLAAVARVGNTYTASLYLCLASLLEAEGRALAGERLGLFSYGSGCCAEFFTGSVPEGVEAVADAGVAALLAGRTFIDVPAYQRLARRGQRPCRRSSPARGAPTPGPPGVPTPGASSASRRGRRSSSPVRTIPRAPTIPSSWRSATPSRATPCRSSRCATSCKPSGGTPRVTRPPSRPSPTCASTAAARPTRSGASCSRSSATATRSAGRARTTSAPRSSSPTSGRTWRG